MHRTLILFLIAAGFAALAIAEPAEKSLHKDRPMLKTVFHVNFADEERQEHGLRNIENILKEEAETRVVVVCHGEGISLLEKSKSKRVETIEELVRKGIRFIACENTMNKKSLDKDDLVAGTSTVPSGAVEVIRRQRDGYAYFKP